LLLDDNGIAGLDPELRALDDLPNLEVRLFNPFTVRRPKLLSFAFDFFRLNRRMHNKSFTADGAASVVGGRNVGDIYFAFGRDAHYIDTDVMALDLAAPYLEAISQSPLMRTLFAGPEAVEWAQVTLVTDDPAKGLGQQGAGGLLIDRLVAILTDQATGPRVSVDLISAYFVPGQAGTDLLTSLAAQGVAVRVLTNAQEATDVVTVHGSYAEYRPALLAGGVRLGELRADPLIPRQDQRLATYLVGSASSLHSKVFAIDGQRVFIGSFNFDPRSAQLNTEMGLLIESPTFAQAVTRAVGHLMERGAYALRLSPTNTLEWVTQDESGAQNVQTTEPNTTWFDRALVRIIGVLPVEWMM
jgi:putative cardiolipin synthase